MSAILFQLFFLIFMIFKLLFQITYKAAYYDNLGKCPYITETPQRQHHREMKNLSSSVSKQAIFSFE